MLWWKVMTKMKLTKVMIMQTKKNRRCRRRKEKEKKKKQKIHQRKKGRMREERVVLGLPLLWYLSKNSSSLVSR